jgi:hypothetical protein
VGEYDLGAMNKPLAPPEGKRSRGNPNWGKPLTPIPTLLTEFEIEVERLRLGRSQYGCLAGLIVWRITAKRRMAANLNPIKAELQRRKHHRNDRGWCMAPERCAGLDQYHAVPGNSPQLRIFAPPV